MATANKGNKDDDDTTAQKTSSFPMIGLGSSAGGLEATEAFFKNVSPDSGMAYAIVSHLEPTHTSLLTEIISRSASIKVVQAEDEMIVQPNEIYVIPPGKYMQTVNGTLRLSNRKTNNTPFLPIDFFFQSLAEDRKENAVAVVLSGNGSDGSVGIRSIHSNLGLIIVQDPETARFDSMPRSAIGTGLVDYVLPPEEMPDIIRRFFESPGTMVPHWAEPGKNIDGMQRILSIVMKETGHDFSLYKKSTIQRRIERRLKLHQIESLEQYASYLKDHPPEVRSLFNELLIEVTSFFRNPEAFEALKENLRNIVIEPGRNDPIRAWVVGCSTGEEAYSIGIILRELMDETGMDRQVQIFGSDINEELITIARKGEYPWAIVDHIDPERLDKYFTKQEGGYKVRKVIRDMTIFAPHDVGRDPPFIHLALLSCRNLLIYFEPMLQKRVLETFSNALNPNGVLFLGESESISGFEKRFTVVDPKWRIYQRRPYVPSLPTREVSAQPVRRTATAIDEIGPSTGPSMSDKADRILLAEYTPPGLIVNDQNEIVHFHGRTRKYLGPAPGRASLSIQTLLRDEIRYSVISAIQESRSSGETVVKEAVRAHSNGDTTFLNIIARPLDENRPVTNVMVIFDEGPSPMEISRTKTDMVLSSNEVSKIDELEKELNYTKESLRNTIEKLEAANEELTSTNEELQSNNEELQSVAEESDTTKEELHSLNEELMTVNSELEAKNQELVSTSSDMRNFLNSIDVAIIFLDNMLNIRRFTPQTEKIMNLRPGDVGRSIEDIATKLQYEDLTTDVRTVLETLNTIEKEIRTKDGHWYRLKILPYRTIESVIDGVVLTFNIIDAQKMTQ
ncbi:MAG: PAS domain-containing protein [Methanomassiliicoccales archaeon]|nr:PAS domain-containing protein [Methanomassiliicoccales archaeon]